ncbi:hypothetical protein [Enhygromyxa salina]|uniref:Uncharacterized protein n=1 Tax=Enhygromyxa salina TaxID=215803 RepID=A0A2S9YIC0_9BACT|nr:hypothetical protein [Enhygromyxa salina]PRQ04801.1 hypothetical protein ENSA7_49740 [Enhygromyxa salina]
MIPLALTESRAGAWGGALAVGFVSAFALAAGLWTANLLSPTSLLAPLTTGAVFVGLTAILGSLAGALAFASDSKGLTQQLRSHIDLHQPVVLVHGTRELPLGLAKFRPISVGAIK